MRIVLALVALSVIPIFFLYQSIVGAIGVALAMTIIMLKPRSFQIIITVIAGKARSTR